MSQTRVTVIPPRMNLQLVPFSAEYVKKRVAAYARVSTDTEEQLSSYEAQVDHYTRHIQANDEWEFVKVYTDEGISATSTAKRDGFKQMVLDALDGKINLIITKSVSRFARNTVDSLTTVRQLKEKGVEVYFEKENFLSENLSQKSGITQNTPRYAAITSETRGVFSLPKRAGV